VLMVAWRFGPCEKRKIDLGFLVCASVLKGRRLWVVDDGEEKKRVRSS